MPSKGAERTPAVLTKPDTVSLKRAYQQADADTILSVVLNGGELREEQA